MRENVRGALFCALVLGLAGTGPAMGQPATVVNIDFEAGVAADTNHVGDDGALSSPGGTLWTSVVTGVDTSDLPDEFGGATPFDVAFAGSFAQTFNDAGINNLQDSGTSDGFQIRDLVPGGVYTIVGYVGQNGGFSVTDNSGFINFFGFGSPGADGWSLPGTAGDGGDYLMVGGLVPFDTGGGSYGLQFDLDGTVTGFQITGPVPEPASLSMIALGLVPLLRRKRG